MSNEIIVDAITTTTAMDSKEESKDTAEQAESKETERTEETLEARKARLQGSLKRMVKDLEDMGEDATSFLNPKVEKQSRSSKKSNDLDYGEKAFLVSNGIKVNEISFAQDLMKKTGLTLDEFVVDDYAQAKLKGYRENQTAAQAVPSGTKRSSTQTKDSVDYHLEKYESGSMQLSEMPFDMRAKVLTAKLKKEESASQFNFTPTIR